MEIMNILKRTDNFLKYFRDTHPLYSKAIQNCYANNGEAFTDLAEIMLGWAEALLGREYLEILSSGYIHFVNDVNRSQFEYELDRKYKNKSYEEVYTSVYNNDSYMALYHWGVFTTTFAWEHHLRLYQYFVEHFKNRLGGSGNILDLGSGSGIWSLLTLRNKKNWRSTGVDISGYAVDMAKQLSLASGHSNATSFIVDDALEYKTQDKYDAIISCFLLEHLEEPGKLFRNAASNLNDGGYAFITAALTAAEIDHIFEFRNESDLVMLAEESGFRVISMLSESPRSHPRKSMFLPRSMAIVLQKKMNDIW
jgi:2-polyprenyl-3-methyl-5-hydroxy-6-metoxy-1,4-benzoquinol methylase